MRSYQSLESGRVAILALPDIFSYFVRVAHEGHF